MTNQMFKLSRLTIIFRRVKEACVPRAQVLSRVLCLGAVLLGAIVDHHPCAAVYGGPQRGGPEETGPCGAFGLLRSLLGHQLGHQHLL